MRAPITDKHLLEMMWERFPEIMQRGAEQPAQIAGFDVVLDESMPPNTMKFDKPAQQEPVAWALSHSRGLEFSSKYPMQKSRELAEQMACQHMGKVTVTPLYTSPPTLSLAQRQSLRDVKPLTDDEIESINVRLAGKRDLARLFARAIEAAHNIKEQP